MKAQVDDQGLHFSDDVLVSKLEHGNYIVSIVKDREPKTLEEYRAEYFAKRDILAADTGNSKKDIHEEAKRMFLGGLTTKTLTEDGWKKFINQFKEWAFEHFGCYL